eukprot:tig00000880_g5212.t1
MVWSPTGAAAAVGVLGDEIVLYDTRDPVRWQQVAILGTAPSNQSSRSASIRPLGFSRSDRFLVGFRAESAEHGHLGYIWDLQNKNLVDDVKTSVRFAMPASELQVQKTIVDLNGQLQTVRAGAHEQKWTAAVFEEGDARFATASADGFVRVFNTEDAGRASGKEGMLAASSMRHGRAVLSLAWAGAGAASRVASMGADGRIVVWEPAAGAGRAIAFLFGIGGPVPHGAFSPSGQHLYTSTGPYVQKWDLRKAEEAADRAHNGAVTCVSLSPGAAGREPVVVSCALDRPVLVVTAAVARPQGRPARLEVPCEAASRAPISAVAAAGDDAALVGFADGTVALFATAPTPDGRPAVAPLAAVQRAHSQPVTAVAAAPGGGRAASADRAGNVQSAVASLRFSHDGQTLACAALDGAACLLALGGGALREAARYQAGRPQPVFAAAGPLPGGGLAVGVGDEVAAYEGKRAGAEAAAWRVARVKPAAIALAMAASPDGARVALVSHEKTVSVLDARTGSALFACPFLSADIAVLEAKSADVQWAPPGGDLLLRVAFGFASGSVIAAAVQAPAH